MKRKDIQHVQKMVDKIVSDMLTQDELKKMKWKALDGATFKLNDEHRKQFFEYILSEAEEYSSGHSMRYTILKAAVKATITS